MRWISEVERSGTKKIQRGVLLDDLGIEHHGVAGKAGEGLGNDEVDLAVNRICDHTIEAVTILMRETGYAVINVKPNELPPRVASDIGIEIIGLRLQAVLLFFLFGGNTSVGCDP